MSAVADEMMRSALAVLFLACAVRARPAAAQSEPGPSFSRIALKIDNLLIVGNRISMTVVCVVRTPLTDSDLQRRGIEPKKWRADYCAQALRIVEPWARQFRQHGNFHLLPRGVADASFARIKLADDDEVPAEALADLGRKLDATHLLLVQEKITPRGRQLTEQRVLQLVDLATGDVLAVDEGRF